jgi:hypothetical protein
MSFAGFRQLDTFPDYIIRGGQVPNVALGERTKCAMCGELCVYGMPKNGENTILKGNKGVCTVCTTTGFILPGGNDAFKWCATHHTFRPMDDFGDRPMASSCSDCREKRRERERRAASRTRGAENSLPNDKHLLRLSGKT